LGEKGRNYCFKAQENTLTLKDTKCTSFLPCQECEGECSIDDDCYGNLKCKSRSDMESVAGCSGEGVSGTGYCYDATNEDGGEETIVTTDDATNEDGGEETMATTDEATSPPIPKTPMPTPPPRPTTSSPTFTPSLKPTRQPRPTNEPTSSPTEQVETSKPTRGPRPTPSPSASQEALNEDETPVAAPAPKPTLDDAFGEGGEGFAEDNNNNGEGFAEDSNNNDGDSNNNESQNGGNKALSSQSTACSPENPCAECVGGKVPNCNVYCRHCIAFHGEFTNTSVGLV